MSGLVVSGISPAQIQILWVECHGARIRDERSILDGFAPAERAASRWLPCGGPDCNEPGREDAKLPCLCKVRQSLLQCCQGRFMPTQAGRICSAPARHRTGHPQPVPGRSPCDRRDWLPARGRVEHAVQCGSASCDVRPSCNRPCWRTSSMPPFALSTISALIRSPCARCHESWLGYVRSCGRPQAVELRCGR